MSPTISHVPGNFQEFPVDYDVALERFWKLGDEYRQILVDFPVSSGYDMDVPSKLHDDLVILGFLRCWTSGDGSWTTYWTTENTKNILFNIRATEANRCNNP